MTYSTTAEWALSKAALDDTSTPRAGPLGDEMAMTERINTTIPADMRDRFEAWRAGQYRQTGRIPSLADAARTLIHKGLCSDGFPVNQEGGSDE